MPPRPQFCVGAFVVHGGRLLMIRRGTEPEVGKWSVPGGRLELGETMAAGVEREVLEETGVAVRCGGLATLVERFHDTGHVVIADFHAEPVAGSAEPMAGDDASEAAWIPVDAIGSLDLVSGLLEVLTAQGIAPTSGISS